MNPLPSPSISFPSGLTDVAESLRRVTVQILGRDGSRGAGVVWRSDGLIVTNAHVLRGPAMVQLHDGRTAHAEPLRRQRQSDLAALRVPLAGLPRADLRHPQTLRPGEVVVAVGHPMGVTGAVSTGIVHAVSASTWIEADIRLSPGNSGGPLADAAGRVVGINSMVVNGMGIAVSTAAVEQFLGQQPRPRLGVTLHPVPNHTGRAVTAGFLVVELEPGGAAHLGGLLVGDVLTAAGGRSLRSLEDLADALEHSGPELQLDIIRAGAAQSYRVRLRRDAAIAEDAP